MPSASDSWVSQIRKGVVEMAVLSLLAERERYGSEIVETLKSHPELAITGGTVYPLMARLKKSGVIDSSWRESPVGPPRKYYRLTATGRAQLSEMASAWHGVSKTIDGLLKGID
ncbi:MAG TPA: PadR family transcriptional regulator [Coriobacteriia bacterium]|nr:PadR family transcriptional regulator [Coriobacteriia bacterium]